MSQSPLPVYNDYFTPQQFELQVKSTQTVVTTGKRPSPHPS
jgi:hypothetical protein